MLSTEMSSRARMALTNISTVNMEKFKPLVFDHATYDYLKVDGIAGKAFEAGKCLM